MFTRLPIVMSKIQHQCQMVYFNDIPPKDHFFLFLVGFVCVKTSKETDLRGAG